jgi:hypothetical protein
MKYTNSRPYAEPEAAAHRVMEIAKLGRAAVSTIYVTVSPH